MNVPIQRTDAVLQGLDFAAQLGSEITLPCDVASDAEIQGVFDGLDDYWDHFDILVHSVAFANREELQGSYLDTVTREGFRLAHDISSYSFAALANAEMMLDAAVTIRDKVVEAYQELLRMPV